MDFVKREDQNIIDEENYKIYMETLQKTHQMEVQDYQHTPISMEQLHQAMQTSLNGTIMHNFQLPLSPRQMSTLMLKTNHLSRNLNFNEIPAHLQRNLELDLVHNLTEMPQNLRHDDLLSRNLDMNLARSLSNDLELQNSLTQSLVQNLNDNLIMPEGLSQNLRNEMHEMNHEIDLSHHLNRNIEQQELLNHDRRTPIQCVPEHILDQNMAPASLQQTLGQRLEQTLVQRLDQRLDQSLMQRLDQNLVQRLDQRLEQSMGQRLEQNLGQRIVTQNMHLHDNQRLESDHLLPMPFHIKSEQEDDGYFYENMNQPVPNVSSMNGHIPDHTQTTQANLNPDQMYVYSNQINVSALNPLEQYPRQNYPQNYTARDNPQNLVVHRQYENSSPYDEAKKDHRELKESKNEEPKENLKPNDQNKMYYQDFQQEKTEQKSEDVSLDIKGEYNCYKCNVVFPSKRLLKQHSKTCNDADIDNNEKMGKFSCSQCSYRCQAPATLKIHERTHTGEKPFSCTFCDYKSGQKNNVAKHILVHMKEKPFRCQYCDYRCAQKNNLVVHERTHTGYKPFACPYCDYRTVQKPNLVKHMYLHTDQKPFSCDVCNYRCVQKTNLTKHKQRHLNEKDSDKVEVKGQIKPYRPRQKSVKCPHCNYRCVQKASLEKHILFKHSEFNEQGLNLMKSSAEDVQNLSVKRDEQMFECLPQEMVKESLQIQS